MDNEPKSDQGGTHGTGRDQTRARRDARSAGQPGRKLVSTTREIAGLVRDIGLIIGVPTLIGVGVSLYELQDKALQEQINANKAQADALTAQNAFLKETQYDRAAALLKGQKEVYEADRQSVEKQLNDTKKDSELKVSALEQKLKEAATSSQAERDELGRQISDIKSADAQTISALEAKLSQRNKEIRSSDVALNTLGSAAVGTDVKNGVITIGVSPTDIAALVRSAADAATGIEAGHIAELSKQLALSEDATRSMLRILGEANVPHDQLPAKLAEFARKYRELQQRLTDTQTNQAPSDDLIRQAREKLESGKLDEASASLEQAQQAELQRAAQALSRAATSLEKLGDIAMTKKDAAKAASYYGRAASILASANPDESARLRARQAEAEKGSH